MKKIILAITLIASCLSFAQEQENTSNKTNVTLLGEIGTQTAFGINIETFAPNKKNASLIVKGFWNTLDVDILGGGTAKSSGEEYAIGSRIYFNKDKAAKGIYYSNYLTYGKHKFTDSNYTGVYDYFSFVRPELGYRLLIGDFNIDINAMGMWKIEINGRGDVDNKDFDNFEYRGGIGVGYTF